MIAVSALLDQRRRIARIAHWWVACTAVLILAGCWISINSDGGGPTSSVIVLRINGLPVGADATVTISGPNVTFIARGSTTYSGLSPGRYVVTASEVLTGTAIARPTPVSQSITLRDNEIQAVTINYALTGAFAVRYADVIVASGGVVEPIFLAAPPGDARLFIAERAGRIRIVQNGNLLATPFLDLSARISTAGEGGLLSFALHPQFATHRSVFVHFTNTAGNIVVERYAATVANPNVAETVATPIIVIPHPTFTNHYGGRVAFGPDGMLYLSTGDGGGAGDPNRNAQNLSSLLGKLLRVDVSIMPYSIPPSNPYVGQAGRRAEIWAYGLRNPWRFAFDPTAATLFIADVGQGEREEVNAVPIGAAGLNFGWPVTEGTVCFPTGTPCDGSGLQPPIHDYDHRQGCSIVGGFVYRGAAMPELVGRYFYADYCGGWLRSLRPIGGTATERIEWNLPSIGQVVSFGEDAAGELYVLANNGRVARIVRN